MDAMSPNRIETPSGKGSGDENFPVGSFLISKELRPHVAVYYAFARAIDDIADNPKLAPEDKVTRLDAMDKALIGAAGALCRRPGRRHQLRRSVPCPWHQAW